MRGEPEFILEEKQEWFQLASSGLLKNRHTGGLDRHGFSKNGEPTEFLNIEGVPTLSYIQIAVLIVIVIVGIILWNRQEQPKRLPTDDEKVDFKKESPHTFAIKWLDSNMDILEPFPIEALTETDPKEKQEHVYLWLCRSLEKNLPRANTYFSDKDKRALARSLIDSIFGYGPLQVLLDDKTVSAIFVESPSSVFVKRNGEKTKSEIDFLNEKNLQTVADRFLKNAGKDLSKESPRVVFNLPEGLRVEVAVNFTDGRKHTLNIEKIGS